MCYSIMMNNLDMGLLRMHNILIMSLFLMMYRFSMTLLRANKYVLIMSLFRMLNDLIFLSPLMVMFRFIPLTISVYPILTNPSIGLKRAIVFTPEVVPVAINLSPTSQHIARLKVIFLTPNILPTSPYNTIRTTKEPISTFLILKPISSYRTIIVKVVILTINSLELPTTHHTILIVEMVTLTTNSLPTLAYNTIRAKIINLVIALIPISSRDSKPSSLHSSIVLATEVISFTPNVLETSPHRSIRAEPIPTTPNILPVSLLSPIVGSTKPVVITINPSPISIHIPLRIKMIILTINSLPRISRVTPVIVVPPPSTCIMPPTTCTSDNRCRQHHSPSQKPSR